MGVADNLADLGKYLISWHSQRPNIAYRETKLFDKYFGLETSLCSDEKEEMLDELRAIQKKADQQGKYGDAISAIKQRSKMRGFDAPIETKANLTLDALIDKIQENVDK